MLLRTDAPKGTPRFRAGFTCALVAILLLIGSAAMSDGFLPQIAALDLSSDQAHPGDTLTSSWEFVNAGDAAAEGDHTVFVHLRPAAPGDPDVPPAAGADFRPFLPTFLWAPGTVIRESGRPIRIPDDFPPGRYAILVGMYDPEGGGRLKLANEEFATTGSRYRLAVVEVVPADRELQGKPISLRMVDTADLPTPEELLRRVPEPDGPVLDSGELRVVLSSRTPSVLRYETPAGGRLWGDSAGLPPRARITREADGSVTTRCLRETSCRLAEHSATRARYAVTVPDGDAVAAEFDVTFILKGNVLRVGVERVTEPPGYLLMDVYLPQVVSARAPEGQLVLPTQSGRLVRLDRARPGAHVISLNWFEADVCGAVVGEDCVAAIRTRDWDNELEARVCGPADSLAGGYAPRLALRAAARGSAARMKLATAPALEVAVLDGAGLSWVDAAKWLRKDIAGSPNPVYDDCIIYKIFCDSPGAKDFTTFAEALGVIRRVHDLAPWIKQIVYLVGWQYEGHDTGYPATDKINERLGGLAGLQRAAEEAAKLNAVLSYHDNFDDAYMDSPLWDPAMISRDESGNLRKGGVWAGGQSYILAFGKYAAGPGLQRVRRTLSQMPVRESYHIDVLSAVPVRRDHNPESPENTQQSLAGKFAIVREFNARGIDVTSEGFTAPFVGVLGHCWHLWQDPRQIMPGEEMIPFVPVIYHGGPTTYGHGGGGATYPQETALLGATYSSDWTKHTDPHHMAEMIYLVVAPWTYLRGRKIEDYEAVGGVRRLVYGDDTFVEVSDANGAWRVVVDGRTLVKDDLAVLDRGDILAVFSKPGRRATVNLPEALRGKELRATNGLTGEAVAVEVEGDAITLDLPASEPVLVRTQ